MAARGARLRLAALLGLLFVLLAIPSAVLLVQTRRQIEFEAFHQYRTLADELGLRIDAELQRLVAAEEARGYADYRFVVVAGDPATSTALQRSPLARYPVSADLPGVIGYFQVAADGEFSTPLLPDDLADPSRWGLEADEVGRRVALRDELLDVLRRNALLERRSASPDTLANEQGKREGRLDVARRNDAVGAKAGRRLQEAATLAFSDADKDSPAGGERAAQALVPGAARNASETAVPPAAERVVASQAAFDKLNTLPKSEDDERLRKQSNELGKVDELRIGRNYQDEALAQTKRQAPVYEQKLKASLPNRATRKEQTAVVDAQSARANAAPRVRTFESELDPFEYSRLDAGRGVLFRKVWRGGQRTIQGLILDEDAFLTGTIVRAYEATALAQMSDLVISYRHDVLRVQRAADAGRLDSLSSVRKLTGELLHQLRLSAPFDDLQLLWNVRRLPAGPGGKLVTWAGVVLLVLLVGTFALLYRLGLRQLNLARQQQDFVSAVSHELNTPLTSIRMYAEILSEGWADAAKQREYYAFIQAESERLSRLIANVLQLARMERRELRLDLKPVRIATLLDLLRSKLASQIERSGFAATYTLAPELAECELQVDADAFVQILINLVDNALKFSAKAARREIDIAVLPQGGDAVWSVRDYGPGVDKSQLRKIFDLFYRPGSELTRETLGTGIGLALVRQLARAMHGEADVVQREPGAEFVLRLPLKR
ncbi:MAG TPA: HAMP domain-containing sensor histidine kinase [Tahibacter sp.]|uniref:sensor histidine kinase n=1 Tax=Tahibacter sp. TaxID=2056211 RepID=UPI002B64BF72|nr:HAMP domain-containing sensor histidine kinase [Tahibacter sp.]HSX60197.1 HAMP domain-containing sensor histidine kinase [Tahibacter sp.]